LPGRLRPNFSLHYQVDPSVLNFDLKEGCENTCDYASLERCVISRDTLARQAYDVGSRYVHGGIQDKKWNHESLSALARNVADYARVALLIFLRLRRLLSRSDLLILVDHSLLDDPSQEKLKGWCRKVEDTTSTSIERC
jgi:hypothetical protein